MIEIVWEFVVREAGRGLFELTFGPGGAWSRLFGPAPGFRGTTVMQDVEQPGRYLVVEIWDTGEGREALLAARPEAVADLEAELAALVVSRTGLGVFRVRAEATVQPRGRPTRGGKGAPRRRGR